MNTPTAVAVYYGWPGEVNGSRGDETAAIEAFRGYSEVVLGEGNVLPGADPSAAVVVAGLARRGARVFGYVDLGVTAGSRDWSTVCLADLAEAWRSLGVGGLFFDCAGRDYGVSPRRLASAVRLCRARRLAVLVNAWDPHDVLEAPTPLRRGDGYLAENAALDAGEWSPPSRYRAKLAALTGYRASIGVRLYTTATTGAGPVDGEVVAELRRRLAPYRIDGLALSDPCYGARDDTLVPARLLGPA